MGEPVSRPSRVVLIDGAASRLHELRAIVPEDVAVERVDGPPFHSAEMKTGDSPLVVVEAAVSEGVLTQVIEAYAGAPLVVWVRDNRSALELNRFLLRGIRVMGVLTVPFDTVENRETLARVLEISENQIAAERLRADLARANELLNRRLQALNTLYTVGKFIVSTLDHDEVLKRIMDVALHTTQAEESFILLREGEKLFLRAAKNVQDDLVERLYLEAMDNVAWRVIRSGRPVLLQRETEIATGYLARALLYVPLTAPGEGPFGVIAIINRTRDEGFDEEDLFTLSSIADYAAITLRNARLFETVEVERSRLRALMEGAAEVILIADERGRLLLWSEMARRLFDIPATARGRALHEVIAQPDLLDLLEQASVGKESLHTEITLDEELVFNTQLSYAPGLGCVIIMQDITHLKELDRLKSEFVSMVSHDLRTPLTTIQGYVSLLEKAGPLNEIQAQFVDKALDSLRYITELITDLLDIGRIEAGYNLEMKRLRFDDLLEETCSEMAAQAAEAGLTLRWACDDGPLWVKGNAHRLRQVLENLISNAIKYNRPEGWIEVQARDNDGHVIVDVGDSGLGIPVEEQARIFERFYRVQRPETAEIQGTGLGLAIVKSVVEHHNGRVWVESEVGKGSTFSFVLPLILDEER
ncbi:MAG: ATP-binding protein [Anaerolineae bacterium]